MRIFTKKESIVVFSILLVVFVLSFFNYQVALRRGRDNARENDLSDIARVLDRYNEENGVYPTSLADPELKKYGHVPQDPGTTSGYSYYYITNGKFYQVYTSLEGKEEEALYSSEIEKLNLKCGNFICNYGKASGNVPLDKTLEEYENEIRQNEN